MRLASSRAGWTGGACSSQLAASPCTGVEHETHSSQLDTCTLHLVRESCAPSIKPAQVDARRDMPPSLPLYSAWET